MESKEYNKFEKAQRKIVQIKSFYHHLIVFVIFNAVLLLSKNKMISALFGENTLIHSRAMDWVYWNILIWGLILGVHAIFVFGNVPFFVKKWEERQIKKFMEEDKPETF